MVCNKEKTLKIEKTDIFRNFWKISKQAICGGIGHLDANFHEVIFKKWDFSGKSVFFRIFVNLTLLGSQLCKKLTNLIYQSFFVSQDFWRDRS